MNRWIEQRYLKKFPSFLHISMLKYVLFRYSFRKTPVENTKYFNFFSTPSSSASSLVDHTSSSSTEWTTPVWAVDLVPATLAGPRGPARVSAPQGSQTCSTSALSWSSSTAWAWAWRRAREKLASPGRKPRAPVSLRKRAPVSLRVRVSRHPRRSRSKVRLQLRIPSTTCLTLARRSPSCLIPSVSHLHKPFISLALTVTGHGLEYSYTPWGNNSVCLFFLNKFYTFWILIKKMFYSSFIMSFKIKKFLGLRQLNDIFLVDCYRFILN